ncbi:hypothetical protein [Sphingomonas sp.]|uniref:hypothetical protein n=1 Tax=Sphingomonas sp. TaxID=28214 RepID=UPI003B3A5903
MKDIASFRIEDGCRIIVDPDHHADETLVQVFLLGSAFGFLIHQRGLLPLHAGCVELGGQAVAFAGESGAGKSTLVAAFVQAGFPMLADDITVIDPHAAGGPVVLPSFPRIKLWRHALDGLGISALELPRVRDELDKYLLPADAHFRTEPLPLGALYHLSQVNEPQQAGVEPLRGKEAIDGILDAVYRRRSALAMRRHGSMLAAAMRLGNVPQARLRRYPDLSLLPKTVQEITARHA